jgi:hypothetical protein
MAANFGFIANATERDANEFASGSMADGHGQGSLADARRTYEAENGAFGVFYQLANGQELQDAVFDFLEAVVLFVENLFGGQNVANFFRSFLPGYSQQPVEIIAADGRFCRHRGHEFQAFELLGSLLVYIFGHASGVDFLL